MSAIGPRADAGRAAHVLAPTPAHAIVVIVSPESAAWAGAFEAGPGVLILDPLRAPDAGVIGPLQPPNEGPPETAMPRWAVYDCAEVPGAVIGLLRTPLGSPYRGVIDPLALLVATPHAEPGWWHLYGLTTAHRPEGHDDDALRVRLIRDAARVLRAEMVTLVLPWNSGLLARLAMVGRLELICALTPLHGPTPSATLAFDGRAAEARDVAHGIEIPMLPADRDERLRVVQGELEAGRRFALLGDCRGGLATLEVRG